MKFRNLAVVIAALFLVAACESTSTESGKGSGDGKQMAKKGKKKGPPKGFSITPGSSQDLVVNVGDRVFFGYDQYTIKSRARGTLERQAAWLRRNASATITVEGHCDERGTREYNLGLGQRRADAVKKYLVALGVAENRIATISYGKERPVAMGSNDEAWAQNRRGVTHIN